MTLCQRVLLLCCLVSTVLCQLPAKSSRALVEQETSIRKAWYGFLSGAVDLSVRYPVFGDWTLRIIFPRSADSLDICQDLIQLEDAVDLQNFTFTKGPAAPDVFLPSEPLRIPFLTDTWSKLRGMTGDLQLYELGPPCRITRESKCRILAPKLTAINVPVNFGLFSEAPFVSFHSSVFLESVEVIDTVASLMVADTLVNFTLAADLLEFDGVTALFNLTSTVDQAPPDNIDVDLLSFILAFLDVNIRMVFRLEYRKGAVEYNPMGYGVTLFPGTDPSVAPTCNCAELTVTVDPLPIGSTPGPC